MAKKHPRQSKLVKIAKYRVGRVLCINKKVTEQGELSRSKEHLRNDENIHFGKIIIHNIADLRTNISGIQFIPE